MNHMDKTDGASVVTMSKTPWDNGDDFGNPIVPGVRMHLDANTVIGRSAVAPAWQYTWRLVAAPDGSHAQICYRNLVRASFVPDVKGRYLIELEASTSRGVARFITRICVGEAVNSAIAVLDIGAATTSPGTPIRLLASAG